MKRMYIKATDTTDRLLDRVVEAFNELTAEEVMDSFSEADFSDPQKCARKCLDIWISKHGTRGSCPVVAGYMSKVFDVFNVPYVCCIGLAYDPSSPAARKLPDSGFDNHCWVESNGNNYEYFEGTRTLCHKYTTYEFVFK